MYDHSWILLIMQFYMVNLQSNETIQIHLTHQVKLDLIQMLEIKITMKAYVVLSTFVITFTVVNLVLVKR